MSEHGELLWVPDMANRQRTVVAWLCETLVSALNGGRAFTNLAVLTDHAGVRVPDVAWLPAQSVDDAITDEPMRKCPPLIAEVSLPGSHLVAMNRRVAAYLDAGARQVLVIDVSGLVRSYPPGAGLLPPDIVRPPPHMFESRS
ncbi:Uma2 family endonuclease [Pseudorhodoferax soli]|uniref:Uma2 family endonuclease n=1 Tax=Pseudorhodoferax soli TaxID=545864 RepID=UPI001474EAE6